MTYQELLQYKEAKIIQWRNGSSFGFVRLFDGREAFCHRSKVAGQFDAQQDSKIYVKETILAKGNKLQVAQALSCFEYWETNNSIARAEDEARRLAWAAKVAAEAAVAAEKKRIADEAAAIEARREAEISEILAAGVAYRNANPAESRLAAFDSIKGALITVGTLSERQRGGGWVDRPVLFLFLPALNWTGFGKVVSDYKLDLENETVTIEQADYRTTTSYEEVRGSYGDSSWGTGNYAHFSTTHKTSLGKREVPLYVTEAAKRKIAEDAKSEWFRKGYVNIYSVYHKFTRTSAAAARWQAEVYGFAGEQ